MRTMIKEVTKSINKIDPLFLIIGLFIMFLIPPLFVYDRVPSEGDMAEYLNNPLRVINGELPYRDFWLIHSPGEVFFPAVLYKIFGLNINNVLIFSVIISALIGIVSFLLGREIFKSNFGATISAVLVFFNGLPIRYLGYTYLHIYFLLLLISALFFIRYLKRKVITYLFLSGIFIGGAFFFRFYEVGGAFLAFFLTNLIYLKLNNKSFRYTVKSLIVFSGGTLLVIGFASLALIKIWLKMVEEIIIRSIFFASSSSLSPPFFIEPISYLRLVHSNLKATISGNIFNAVNVLNYSANFIYTSLFYLLPVLLVGVSIWYLRSKKFKQFDKIIVWLFLFWGGFVLLKSLAILEMAYLIASITPLYFLLIFILHKTIKLKNKTLLEKFILYGLAVILILLLTSFPLYLIKTAHIFMRPHGMVGTQYGTLLFAKSEEAKDIQATINFINKNTKEGDYIFITTWFAPPLYALTNRKNPTYYDSLMDVVSSRLSDEAQESSCKDILNKDTKLIIHNPYWGFSGSRGRQFLNFSYILQECIENNFELAKRYGRYWLYLPK